MNLHTLKLLTGVAGAGVLAGWLMEAQPWIGPPTEVSVGAIEPPLPPPRVRVRNTNAAAVAVAYATEGDVERHVVGTVPPLATLTFPLPEDLGAVRIVVQAETDGEWFMSETIESGRDTDVTVIATAPLAYSVVEVQRLPVIRELPSR